MKVGFIGLGAMGSAMAANILKAEHTLIVHNRSPKKATPFRDQGATIAAKAADAADADVVITMLADDHAVEHVVFGKDGLLAALPENAVHVSMSTISLGFTRKLAEAHAAKGRGFVSAPVFGRPDAAAAAKLFIVAAGKPDEVARVTPLLDALGQRTFIVGSEPEKATLIKLSGNFLITSVVEALGEALALTGKGGIDPAAYLEILTSTLFGAPVYKTYGALIAEGRYIPPGFKASLGYKDLRLVLAAADDLRAPMPLANLIATRLLTLLAQGRGDLDWSALGGLAAQDAGLKPLPPAAT
jgi:3-hydroxyisobutyrate dehydrogenase-like beta-hydroxyacid dehydrogenase